MKKGETDKRGKFKKAKYCVAFFCYTHELSQSSTNICSTVWYILLSSKEGNVTNSHGSQQRWAALGNEGAGLGNTDLNWPKTKQPWHASGRSARFS